MAANAIEAPVKMRTIRLYGRLGHLFGRVHKLAVSSPAEAVHALGVMVDGFKSYLLESKSKGVQFAVFVGKTNITQDELRNPPGKQDIRIAPVPTGRKGGGGIISLIAGAVLIVVGAFTGNGFLIAGGAALLLGGVLMMTSPQQKGLGTDDDEKNRPSYNFNGAVNTSAQGRCVPLAYGEIITGSAVISAGIYTEDQQ